MPKKQQSAFRFSSAPFGALALHILHPYPARPQLRRKGHTTRWAKSLWCHPTAQRPPTTLPLTNVKCLTSLPLQCHSACCCSISQPPQATTECPMASLRHLMGHQHRHFGALSDPQGRSACAARKKSPYPKPPNSPNYIHRIPQPQLPPMENVQRSVQLGGEPMAAFANMLHNGWWLSPSGSQAM